MFPHFILENNVVIIIDMDSVGKMQEEALKRKERLKALKEKKEADNSESKLEGEQLPKYECSFTCYSI